METQFKIGDRVKIILSQNESQNCEGDIGVIKEIDLVGYKKLVQLRVHVKGRSNFANWHDSSEVELVK